MCYSEEFHIHLRTMGKKQDQKLRTGQKKKSDEKQSVLDKIENIKNKYSEQVILIFFLLVSLVLSLINFNARISEAHDDALYIEAAYRFVTEFPNYFYTANAPFYPMFLAVLMKLFGFKLIVFKLFNVLFQFLSVYFFFKAFYHRIPFVVFLPLMAFVSFNHHILYFSSMTFTEAIFMFLQGLMFYSAGKLLDLHSLGVKHWQQHSKVLLLFGLSVFLLIITRSGAIVILPTMLFYFYVVLKDKRLTIASILAFLIYFIPYKLLLRLIFGNVSQYSNQSKILLQKDPYDASLGQEDISGFIQRFLDNSELYLSKRFYQILGWMDEQNSNTYAFIALMMWALFLLGIWKFYKEKKHVLLFVALYTLALIVLSFVILQARWDQPRIIMVAMPVMIMAYFYWFYRSFKSNFFKMVYTILMFALIGSMLISTIKRGVKNLPIVMRNLQGDVYYGYTADWVNFLKASEWCGKNLPENTLVASRKAPMSFIYGKRKFFPIYSVIKKDPETNQSNPDSALVFFKQNKVTHILLASLRIDPTKNTGQVINTIHNILEPIHNKYPSALKLVHTEGDTEPCYVYEFVYPENIK
ncbi:MAG: hypothetical protein KatS3mg027_2396 [Bacteroidia bacterium]|nr:MAG: hypothetical protein KatS3mg027_2396 [Bacteroidia bacterium]